MRYFLYMCVLLLAFGLQTACIEENNNTEEHRQNSVNDEGLIGVWRFKEVNLVLEEQFKDTSIWGFPSDYPNRFKDKGFLGKELSTYFLLKFENDTILRLAEGDKHFCRIYGNSINLFRSDYVISLPYSLKGDTLEISDGFSVVDRTLIFEKEK